MRFELLFDFVHFTFFLRDEAEEVGVSDISQAKRAAPSPVPGGKRQEGEDSLVCQSQRPCRSVPHPRCASSLVLHAKRQLPWRRRITDTATQTRTLPRGPRCRRYCHRRQGPLQGLYILLLLLADPSSSARGPICPSRTLGIAIQVERDRTRDQ